MTWLQVGLLAAVIIGALWIGVYTTLLPRLVLLLCFLFLAFGLLVLGQWLARLTPSGSWTFVDKAYVNGLGPEMGGAGLDALLVGGVAGLIATWLQRWRAADVQRASIRRRRSRGRAIRLSDEFAKSSGALPLWGQIYSGDKVFDVRLRRTKFAKVGHSPAELHDVRFDGCDLAHVSFQGCKLIDVQFAACELRGCDFRGATFQTTKGLNPFSGSNLHRCRFDRARVDGVSLEGLYRGCSFWGVQVRDGHLPASVFRALEPNASEDLADGSGGYRIVSLRTFLSGLNKRRAAFLLRSLLARRN